MKVSSPSLAPSKILVVEDDRTTFLGLQLLLKHYNYVVDIAEGVKEGLAKLTVAPPHFLCLDLMLPDGDGIDILSHIRLRSLPTKVAVITATDDTVTLRKVRDLMPDLLLQKPIDFLQLLDAIRGSGETKKRAAG